MADALSSISICAEKGTSIYKRTRINTKLYSYDNSSLYKHSSVYLREHITFFFLFFLKYHLFLKKADSLTGSIMGHVFQIIQTVFLFHFCVFLHKCVKYRAEAIHNEIYLNGKSLWELQLHVLQVNMAKRQVLHLWKSIFVCWRQENNEKNFYFFYLHFVFWQFFSVSHDIIQPNLLEKDIPIQHTVFSAPFIRGISIFCHKKKHCKVLNSAK